VDTIVFREVLNHLDMDAALAKAYAITASRCLVFQGTEILPLRLMKRIYGHREYEQKNVEQIVSGLRRAGFLVKNVIYTDPLAFPLSGGWHGQSWSFFTRVIETHLLRIDSLLNKTVNGLRLGKYLCFRALIVADKGD